MKVFENQYYLLRTFYPHAEPEWLPPSWNCSLCFAFPRFSNCPGYLINFQQPEQYIMLSCQLPVKRSFLFFSFFAVEIAGVPLDLHNAGENYMRWYDREVTGGEDQWKRFWNVCPILSQAEFVKSVSPSYSLLHNHRYTRWLIQCSPLAL